MTEVRFRTRDGCTEEEVLETVRAVILELAPEPVETPDPEILLVEDMAYHSLALLELAFTLEDEFDLPPIDEEIARGIRTIGDVERHVIKELTERDAKTA
ncbi:MAG: acyl carrier protein [Streptosporangiaceae bacterium]